MQIELLEKIDGERKAVFHLKKTSVEMVNALRRAVLLSLPCFAIDSVEIYENNSPFFSEYIANRIGQIPLTFEPSVVPDSKITFSLNAEGPGIITTKDLVSSDEKIVPVNPDFPIVELAANQRIRFEATAILSTAITHAKFQCAHASFSNFPVFDLKKNSTKLKEFYNQIPKSQFDKNGEIKPNKADALEWFIEENPDLGTVDYKNNEFVFQIESYNNVSAIKHLVAAIESLKKDTAEFKKQLKEI